MVDTGDLKSPGRKAVRVQVPPWAFLQRQLMIEFYPQSIYYPREAVEAKFASGELQATEKRLLEFAERHRSAIWESALEDSSEPTDAILLDNLRAFLLSIGSIHPAFEMGELIKEIKKEVWYQNETQDVSPNEIAENWKKTYAIKWREARMFEAFILIERCSKEILNILRATGKV
jgi:hypothetical protein